MNLLVQNGRIIDPANDMDCVCDILITDGEIAFVGDQIAAPNTSYDVVDAAGLVVCPGFIDLHCHLRQPGFEEKETIASGTAAASRGGFTTICCMPNTNPAITTQSVVNQVLNIAQKESIVRVLPIGAVTEDRSGRQLADLVSLYKAGVVAFSDDGSPVGDNTIMRQALEQSGELGVPVIDHCEDMSLSRGGSMNEGIVSAKLELKGIPAEAEVSMVKRDIEIARQTGGRLHIAHVSTAGSVEAIRQAKAQGVSITAEVTPHHLTMTEEMVVSCGAYAKVNPPLQTQKDIDTLVDGLSDGTIDAIATDHAPHTLEDKNCDFSQAAFGISGFETALGNLMVLVHRGDIDLQLLISKLTCEPARILGSSKFGNFNEGSFGDITIFNPDAEWTVDPHKFASKGKNTPLAGTVLKGKVVMTIVGGMSAYETWR